MAAFSSRGPAGAFVKPDVTAPGVQILAGHTPTPQTTDGGARPGSTSRPSPAPPCPPRTSPAPAILLAALHDDWAPGQIKSALMTTAITDLVKEDETTPADPFDLGAGRIDVSAAASPLTIERDAEGFCEWGGDPVNAIHVNIPSVNAPVMPRAGQHRLEWDQRRPALGRLRGGAQRAVAGHVDHRASRAASPSGRQLGTLSISIRADEGVGQQFGQIDLTPPGGPTSTCRWPSSPGQADVTSSCIARPTT